MGTSTPDILAARIAALSPEKRALLERQLQQQRKQDAQSSTIPRCPRKERIPLSFTQERLWFLDQFEPNSALYNMTVALHLEGIFNPAAFRHALTELMARHETLRASFSSVDGTPFQVIANHPLVPLTIIDLRAWANSEREDEALRFITEESQRPFDLAQGPLFRALLIQLDPEEHLLSLTIHHIISDGWSHHVLFRELTSLYEAFVSGHPIALPPLPIQYADFAVWQRQQCLSEKFKNNLTYWKEHLAGAPPLLALPTDRSRPRQQTYQGAEYRFTLPSSLTPALKALSQRTEASLFMTLLAAFQVLLSRYTGQDDIIVGSPIAGRPHIELEGLIGFFANTLVLRTDMSRNPTFRELLRRVRTTAFNAYAHQDVPYEQLVADLQPQRNFSHSPLIQVLFALQNVPPVDFSFAGVQATRVIIENQGARFDLTLLLWEEELGLRGRVDYNTDLFDEATIIRLVGHYQTLLEGIIANPDQPIALLPLLTPAEHQQLVVSWNETQQNYPQKQCLHHIIEAHAKRTPEAIAVVCEGKAFTYSELNSRANQLGQYLRKLGVGPEVLVGIYVERSLDFVVALLGVWKAGGAYLPLDPQYPEARLQFMLADSSVPVLLTQSHLLAALPAFTRARVYIDTDWEKIRQESEANFESNATVHTLAYVIYTSGSTGKPKGVLVEHRGLPNLVAEQARYFGVNSASRVLQFASLSFDASIADIAMALSTGGSLYLAAPEVILADQLLAEFIQQHAITIVVLSPSVLATLPPVSLPTLTTLCVAGEPCPTALAEQWAQRRRFLNLYGPTEATVWSTVAEYHSQSGQLTIGRPIANTQLYVLDAYRNPVPIGVAGELYIGGVGVARGYLNCPELTTEKFIPNPFSGQPGSHLYRTGDLVRYLPDGRLEFLGRIDNQVKIRGFRIELGEIEEVLTQHRAVREASVVTREDPPGDKRLVAYVAPHEHSLTSRELREYLKTKLPEYMVPAAFVFLPTLPLTPNGKVDRRTLPKPEWAVSEREAPFTAPRTHEEEIIAQIWSEVLDLAQVGVHDNFFVVGGHSLKATQVMARLRTALRLELPLRMLFEVPTVAELAASIAQIRKQHDAQTELARLFAEVEHLSESEAWQELSQLQDKTARKRNINGL